MTSAYEILIKKLDEFIRKYYKNILIRGVILFFSLTLALFLVFNIIEYFAYLNTTLRTIIFYIYLAVSIYLLTKWIVIPILKIFKLGKIISYEQASEIIGQHFSEVKDKLLNTLQLYKITNTNNVSKELIEASIEQKIKKLTPIPFLTAINLKVNKKYLKFLLPPLVVLLTFIIAKPAIVIEPSKRYINHSVIFEKEAPFKFVIQNDKLEAFQQQDFKITVKLIGEDIPSEVYLINNGNEYKLNKENNILFNYTFRNVQKDIRFFFVADKYHSKEYTLKVIPKPMILDFEVYLNYPQYTGKKPETIENSGDFTIPQGTKVTWKIKTKDTKSLFINLNNNKITLIPQKKDYYTFEQTFYETKTYTVIPQNEFIKRVDSLTYTINVVPDAYPQINIEEYHDSVFYSRLYFKGLLKDDYGFTKLLFKYRKITGNNEESKEMSQNININKAINQTEFYYYFDVSSLNIEPGDNIEYYFEVWDNDAVNGSKSTKSATKIFKIPTLEEIQAETDKNNTEIKKQIENTIKEISLLQKQIDEINQKMLNKKTLNWQEKNQIENLLQRQQQLHENIENIKEQLKNNNIKEQQFKKSDSTILEKQKQLEELFEKIMSDEMKELFKQMQEMLDKLDKNKLQEMMDKIKLSNNDIEKELDRNLELFKQLEFDKKLTETIEKLQKLSEEQKNLSEKTLNDNYDKNKLLEEQREINEKFNEIKNDLKELENKNKELETPKNLQNTEEKQNAIQKELNNSQSNIENNKRKNASQSQQNAGKKMEELADELEKMQKEMEEEELAEDERSLRLILKNLIKISFDQENLITRLRNTNINDPKYITIMEKQKELQDGLKMIEDSLFALSKRQAIIQPIINKEISSINENTKKTLDALQNRNTAQAQKWQQYTMTSVNNLALLLAEALEQMQKQMQSMSNKSCNKKGGMKCKKPGSGQKPSATTLKRMQEELNKQIEELKKQMEKGNKPGMQGQKSINEQLARLAAQQEAIRKLLQQYGEELKKEGVGNAGQIAEMLKQMEQTETDLVNKMITNETLKRQQEILTRLLESEKAEKERELDEKRKSNEALQKTYSNPTQFIEFNKMKSKEIEMLKTIPVTLTPFFKYKANEYFFKFEDR